MESNDADKSTLYPASGRRAGEWPDCHVFRLTKMDNLQYPFNSRLKSEAFAQKCISDPASVLSNLSKGYQDNEWVQLHRTMEPGHPLCTKVSRLLDFGLQNVVKDIILHTSLDALDSSVSWERFT